MGVTQDNASRIERCQGVHIRSGVSSELATELLPASPSRLTKLSNRCIEWRTVPRAGTTVPPLVPARGTTVIFPGVISVLKRREFHKRTTSRYKGGTGVPPEGTSMVQSCLLDSARSALSIYYVLNRRSYFQHSYRRQVVSPLQPPPTRQRVPSQENAPKPTTSTAPPHTEHANRS